MAARTKRTSRAARVVRRLVRPLLWLAVVAALVAASYVAAVTVWDNVVHRPEFRLQLRALTLNGYPEWVNAERMTEELRGELGALPRDASLFNPDVAAAVQHELCASPWLVDVREVRRVMPNRLQVSPVYRRPAGLVRWNGHKYLVDREGVWLPDELFSPPASWARVTTPLIVDRLLQESPPMGRPWAGPRMAVGAALTEFLRTGGLLEKLELATVDVTGVGRPTAEPDIVLTTAGGTDIKWGASSLYAEVPDLEPPPSLIPDALKLQAVLDKLEEYPDLSGIRYLDPRFHSKIIIQPAD